MVDHDAVRREHGYHPLRVARIVVETPDARSFVLEVPPDVADLFDYRPGQFCTFRVTIDGAEHLRSYSMSSAPEGADGTLTVTVKRVEGGLVSNWLHDHVSEGDVLEATRPAGIFGVSDHDRPILGFCGGSGVTPVMSITRSALASTGRAVRLLYANRDRASVIFADELDALAAAHPGRLAVHHHLDADSGLLDVAAVAAVAGTERDADVVLCGPGPFMDLVERTLLDLGFAPEQISVERFVNPGQPTPLDVAVTADVADPGTTTDTDGVPAEVTIVLKGKRHTVGYHAGDTILETARRGGLAAPFSCEAGNCATCMALLEEGTATMRANHALSADEVAEGWVLTCQAVPHGDAVVVEYESF